MITKKFNKDFYSNGGALTLRPDYVLESPHKNGWTIEGKILEDYYEWVNDFEAFHPVFGRVWGNFESEVHADSEEGFNNFYNNFPPEDWDYGDI